MSAWIPSALAIAIAVVATSAGAGPCPQGSSRNCLSFPTALDFSSVPTISEQIVTQEHPAQVPQKFTTDPPATAPYTGPTFGRSLGTHAPTVGYQWSLE
jgi:hypothetical protein